MPYIKSGLRAELLTEPERAKDDVGAQNFLFTQAIMREWNAIPCYATIHKIRRGIASDCPEIEKVRALLEKAGVSYTDRETAFALAFHECYRRIFALYEFDKLQENGDLPEYEEALKKLNEGARARFDKNIGVNNEKSN